MDPKNYIMQDQYNRTQGAKLKVQNKKFSIYKGVNIIGRNKSAAVDLKNLNISQYHALITIVDDSQHFISDLNSSNGTYLSGTKLVPFKLYEIPNETEVKFGDVIGLYIKMPSTNSTIHLESESMDATQNFTQTFYGAQTQIMFNESSLNQNIQSPVPFQNSSADETPDIHEAATQVVQYPSTINNVKTTNKNSEITEKINYDIHDAPTQVIAPLQQPSTSKANQVDIHEAETQLVAPLQQIDISDYLQENINEITTQVVTLPPDKTEKQKCESESVNSTTLNAKDCTKDNIRKSNMSINQESVIEESVIEESIVEEVHNNRDHEINTDDNSNDSVDFLTVNKPPDIEVKQLNHNQDDDENLTPSDTQNIGRPTKRPVRKLSSSEDLEHSQNRNDKCNSDSETDIEDMDIEKLKDKLNSSQSNAKPAENVADSETDDELFERHNNRDKVVNSDSETDMENDGDPMLPMTQSDDIIKPKVLSKKLNFNSDSDTDVEDNDKNELTRQVTNDPDSSATILNDTDYIPATQDAFAKVFQYKASKLPTSNLNSQNVSSEESFKLGLTELMVDENDLFDKSDKEDDENSPVFNRQLNQKEDKHNISEGNKKEAHKVNDKEISDQNEVDQLTTMMSTSKTGIDNDKKELDEDIYMMPTQRISDQNQKKDSQRTEDIKKLNIPSKNVSDENQHDDFYMMSTQKINNQRNSTAIQDVNDVAGPSTSKVVSDIDKEDIYIMATQKINEEPFHNEEKGDPVQYTIQASTVATSSGIIDKESEADDDVYMIATQKISDEQKKDIQESNQLENNSTVSKAITDDNEEDDEMYMMPTQKIDDTAFKVPQKFVFKKKSVNLDGSLTTILGNKPKDDPYSMDTQKINEIPGSNRDRQLTKQQQTSEIKNIIHTIQEGHDEIELYLQATQELKHVSQDNKEIKPDEDPYMAPTQQVHQDSGNENKNEEVPRGKNITETQTELYMEATQKLEPRSTSDSDKLPLTDSGKDLYDAPTQPLLHNTRRQGKQLSNEKGHVDASNLKRVGDTCPDVPKFKRVKKSDIDNLKKTIKEKVEDAETLSQIEAFVKTPLENIKKVSRPESVDNFKEPKRKELEDSETLSQIEAFVKNPVQNVVSKANQNQINKATSSLSIDQNEKVENISQIDAVVKQPQRAEKEQSKQTGGSNKNISGTSKETVSNKNITRTTRTRQSKNTAEKEKQEKINNEILLDLTKEENKEIDNKKLGKTDENINTSTIEADVKSDIDQSFALLEAKSTKTRKSQRVTNVGEVKVAVRKNRRSMTTSTITELSKNDGKKTTTRKSRRVLNNNIEKAPSERMLEEESLQKKVSQTKHKSDDYDSDFSEPEIPPKIMKTAVTKKSNTKEKVTDKIDDKNDKDVKVISASTDHSKASTSKTRTVTRKGSTKNSGEITEGSSDAESISSKIPLLTPSKRGTNKKIFDSLENKDISTPSTSKARASSRMKKLNSLDTNSDISESSSSNGSILVTPSRRGRNAAPSEATLTMSERSKRKQRPKIVFTMLDNPQLESLIRQLGGTVVDSVDSSTVLVTEHVKRSQKLLTAVGQGKPICSPSWIYASKKANEFLDPWNYILVDKEAESKWNFSLKESITRAASERLLTNYTFQIIVNAAVDVLKGAIEACGGKCVTRNPPKNMEGYLVVVASPESRTKYLKIKKQNPEVTVVEPEAVFDGVLRQELRLGRHLLT